MAKAEKEKAASRPKAAKLGKSAAKPKTRSGGTKEKLAEGSPGVRVRMYRQGLGDCFLLSFPKPGGGDFFVLIDCGVILGTPHADDLMKAVAEDIVKTTRKIDVLVVTHEHWDHVSGFSQAKETFEKLAIDKVWMAWTEDPHDQTANQLREERAQKLAALWLGIGQMQQHLAASGAGDEVKDRLAQAAEVLSFFGIDVAQDQPPGEGFAAAAAAAVSKTGAAMQWARQRTANPEFWKPGDLIPLPEAGGVRVYVLGPPKDRKQLFKDLPTRSGRETYDEGKSLAAATERSFFASAFGQKGTLAAGPSFNASLPFNATWQIGRKDAERLPFFRSHYFGAGEKDAEAWRRIDGDWMDGAAKLALQLDSDTNNTSLALAFELPDGRVLLFPGDAQVGNWESWHVDGDGKPRVWKVDGREVTAEQLLNCTVLYKVGHHGSHNATLREKGLEMMTDPRLVAMVPVDVYVAHKKKRWTRMPFVPLMQRLKDVTKGRILQADQVAEVAQAKDGGEEIEVAGEEGDIKRALYVEYVLV